MGVAVKKPELEDLLEQQLRTGHGDLLGLDTHRANAAEIVDRNAFDELHRQHSRSAQLGKDQRECAPIRSSVN